MKAIKRLIVLIVLVAAVLSLAACDNREITQKTIVDAKYTPQTQEIVTDYEYKYSWIHGDFVLVPNTHTIESPEKYEIKYFVEYDDGGNEYIWENVSKEEYEKALAKLINYK